MSEELDSIISDASYCYFLPSGMKSNRQSIKLDNDNPILQAAVFVALLRKQNYITQSVRTWIINALNITRVCPGVYNRSVEHGISMTNSQDNDAAIVVLEPLGIGPYAEEKCEAGERNGYNFDNQQKPYFSFDTARQLGDVAIYKICCDRLPNIVELLWMTAGFLILAFKKLNFHHHLGWLKLEGLRVQFIKHAYEKSWTHVNLCMFLCFLSYDLSMKLRYKSLLYAVKKYYSDPMHPNVRLAKLIDGDKE